LWGRGLPPLARRRHEGHIWTRVWGRGAHATAVIEKDSPKNERSIRTVALTEATAQLVDEHRARLVERASLAEVEFLADGFVFPAEIDGSKPWRPDLATRRFAKLRDEAGIKARLHDVRHFVATTLLTSGVDSRPWPVDSDTAAAAKRRWRSTRTSSRSPIGSRRT
jgi:hypothetical protein